jgi:hypothetical protein
MIDRLLQVVRSFMGRRSRASSMWWKTPRTSASRAGRKRQPGRTRTPYPSDPGLKWAAGGGDEPPDVEND